MALWNLYIFVLQLLGIIVNFILFVRILRQLFFTGNIDPFASNKCNPNTGVCNVCINNAAGDQCERCKEGYFGNAKNQTCQSKW